MFKYLVFAMWMRILLCFNNRLPRWVFTTIACVSVFPMFWGVDRFEKYFFVQNSGIPFWAQYVYEVFFYIFLMMYLSPDIINFIRKVNRRTKYSVKEGNESV